MDAILRPGTQPLADAIAEKLNKTPLIPRRPPFLFKRLNSEFLNYTSGHGELQAAFKRFY
jgi:hypothetical protein